MKERKWGLVLAGGGGKGAYQFGVLKAMEEVGILGQVVAISGSSIGSLNAAMLAQKDMKKMEEVWNLVRPKDIFSSDEDVEGIIEQIVEAFAGVREYLASDALTDYLQHADGNGFCSREGMERILDENISLDMIRQYEKKIFVSTTKIQDGIPLAEYHVLNEQTDERMKKLLLATSALPVIYDAVDIEGSLCWDGGVADNVPCKPLEEEGIRDFIVIRHSQAYVKLEKLKDTQGNKIEICPSHSVGEFLDGTIDFSHEGIQYRMALGYYDGLTIFQELERIENGMASNELDYKMRLLENHEKAKAHQRRSELVEEVQEHMSAFSKYEHYYDN